MGKAGIIESAFICITQKLETLLFNFLNLGLLCRLPQCVRRKLINTFNTQMVQNRFQIFVRPVMINRRKIMGILDRFKILNFFSNF